MSSFFVELDSDEIFVVGQCRSDDRQKLFRGGVLANHLFYAFTGFPRFCCEVYVQLLH
jgi:hypothetical protein